jgi:hypothetical protein
MEEGRWRVGIRKMGIFGTKRKEITGELIKLHNKEINDLYCLQNIIRVIKWGTIKWISLS